MPALSKLKPTRKNIMLYMIVTNTPKDVNRIEKFLGISDHEAIFAEIDTHPHK